MKKHLAVGKPVNDRTRKPHPTDERVGNRLRLARAIHKVSQERLSQMVGLTFQQIQKYERGENRIGASRMWQFAQALQVPVTYFYEDEPKGSTGLEPVQVDSNDERFDPIKHWMTSPDAAKLNVAFMKITNPKVRKHVVALVQIMANEGALPVEATDGPHYHANAFEPRAA